MHNVSFEVNSFPERTAQLPSSACCRCLASRLTLESSDRCGRLHVARSVFLYKLGPCAQVWHHPSELDPSTSIVGQENAQQLPVGQSYGRIFSKTLAYIKLKGRNGGGTKLKTRTEILSKTIIFLKKEVQLLAIGLSLVAHLVAIWKCRFEYSLPLFQTH